MAFYQASEAFKQSHSTSSREVLHKSWTELDLTLAEFAEKQLRCTHHLFHLKGNKPDAMVARRLRSMDLTTKPNNLQIGHDMYTTNPSKIVKVFWLHKELACTNL